jgi:hypothetical protein
MPSNPDIDFTPFDEEESSPDIPFYPAADAAKFSLGSALNLTGTLANVLSSPAAAEASQMGQLQGQRERAIAALPMTPEDPYLPRDIVGAIPAEVAARYPSGARPLPSWFSEAFAGLGEAGGSLLKAGGVMGELGPSGPEFEGIELPTGSPVLEQIRQERAQRPLSEKIEEAKSSPLFQAGQTAQQYWGETVPPGQDLISKAFRMGGQFGPMVLSGPLAPAEIAATSFSEHLINDYDKAVAAGMPREQAAASAMDKAILSGGIQGAVFAILPAPLRSLGDKYLIDKFGSEAGKWIARRVAGGAEGAAVGATSAAGEQLVSQGKITIPDAIASGLALGAWGALSPHGPTQREITKGNEYASRIREAAKIHGDLLARAREGARQVPAQEGGQGVLPQAPGVGEEAQVPLTLNDTQNLLNPIQTQALHDAAGDLGHAVEMSVVPSYAEHYNRSGLDPEHSSLMWADYPTTDADGNFVPGKIFVSKAAMDRLYQSDMAPTARRGNLQRVIGEELFHSFTTKEDAEEFLGTLTSAERKALQSLYWGDTPVEKRGKVTPGQEGSEAVRIVWQRLMGGDPSEVGWFTGLAKAKPRLIELFASIIRRVREWYGTEAAGRGQEVLNRIMDRMEGNVNRAAEAAGVKAPFEVRAAQLPGTLKPLRPDPPVPESEFPELPGTDNELITIRRRDGSTYRAGMNTKTAWPKEMLPPGIESGAAIHRIALDEKGAPRWSTGMLDPGENIVEPEIRAARQPKGREEERELPTAEKLDASAYESLSGTADNLTKQWKESGKVEKKDTLDFDKFYGKLQDQFGTMDRNAALTVYEKNLWGLLLNAKGEKLEALVRSHELFKEVGDSPIPDATKRESVKAAAETPTERRGRVREERRRGIAISAIARKLLTEAVERGKERKTQVEPTDLYKSKRKTTRGTTEELKQPIYNELGNVEGVTPEKLGQVLTDDSGESGRRTVSETRRVTVLQNKSTGKVDVVSTYRDPRRGPVILDPDSPDQTHSKVESILNRYRPVASILLDEPVKNFRQSYDNLRDYENQFGAQARKGAATPLAEIPTGEGEVPIEGAYARDVPITDAEAGALLDHMLGEMGTIDSPADVKASLDAIGETIAHHEQQLRHAYKVVSPEMPLSPGTRMALNAYRKLAQQLERTNPPGTSAEEIINQLAQNLYETHKASGSYEDFVRGVLGQGGPEARQALEAGSQAPVIPGETRAARLPTRKIEAVASKPTEPTSPGLAEWLRNLMGYQGQYSSAIEALVKDYAGETMPLTTKANRRAGELGGRLGASRDSARLLGGVFSATTLEGTDIPPAKFGGALVEDNLRSIHADYRREAVAARRKGDWDGYRKYRDLANNVGTLVGGKGSPFRTEGEYQVFLSDPAFREAVERHNDQWKDVIGPQYKLAMSMDPSIQLPTRGLQTGARINLKPILEGSEEVKAVPSVGRGPQLTATFKRKSPFGRRATGGGEKYEIDYHELIANTFAKQSEIAKKNAFDNALVKAGLAVIDAPGQQVRIGHGRSGEGVPTESFPLKRRVVITDKDGKTHTFASNENIYVRKDLADEYRIVSDTDKPLKIPVLTPSMKLITKAALAGVTNFAVHGSNLLTALFNRPTSGKLLADTAMALGSRMDVWPIMAKTFIKALQNNQRQIAELTEIAAMRAFPRTKNPFSRVLHWADKTTRLMLDDTYQSLVREGVLEDTETERREYVNGVGQYQRRLQGIFTRLAKDVGFGDFIVATKTFNTLGFKMAFGAPGAKPTSTLAWGALATNMAAKWVGAFVLLGVLNYVFSKKKGGGFQGRPGVKVGDWDTGLTTKRGEPLTVPFMDILGPGRALRETGVRGYITSKKLGLTENQALENAFKDVVNSAISPAIGPPVRFAHVAMFGREPTLGAPQIAPAASPEQKQWLLNLATAAKDVNAPAKAFFDWRSGKPLGEALSRQGGRLALIPAKPDEVARNFPKIVHAGQMHRYTDSVAIEMRKLPIQERFAYMRKRFADDGLTSLERAEGIEMLERKGVFSYR